MAGVRDIRRKARRDLHGAMKVPALYFQTPAAEPAAVGVRTHTQFKALGDLAGGGEGWGERVDTTPKLIFERAEVPQLARTGLVSVEIGEVYQIANVHPADDEFVTVDVVTLTPTQIAAAFPDGQPVPEVP